MTLDGSISNSSVISEEWQPSQSAWLTFNEYRQDGVLCDVVLKVQNTHYPVHRLILCACSEYFRSLFLGGWKSSDRQEIEIPGVSPDIMDALLNYVYTGQVTITSRTVEELLPAADQFFFPAVKEKCISFLKNQLGPENVIGIKKFAKIYYCPELEKAALNYILHNFEDVSIESVEFLSMDITDILQLISDDRLNVKREENVCEAVYRWVRHEVPSRKQFLLQLLQNTRLGLLDSEYIMSKVKGNELIMQQRDEFKELIKEALKFAYDLHSPESNIRLSENSSMNRYMRPRLPTEILLAVGGWSAGSPTNAIEAYDPRAEDWENISVIEGLRNESPRAYHGVAFVNGNIYIVGGFDGVNYFKTMRRYDVIKNQWFQEASMEHKRCYVSVTVMKKKVFALGGMDGENRLNTVEMYDPRKRTWTLLPDMNEQRSDASATSLDSKVYIAGGFNGQECLFTAEFYDPRSNIWTWITPMSSRRSGVSIISLHGMIYAVGGFDGMNRLKSAERYCPLTNTWRPIVNMNKPRSNFGLEVIDDQLIAVGGFNGHQTSSDVEVYDDVTDEWYETQDMQIFRSALSCCVLTGMPYDVIKRFCKSREVQALAPIATARRQPTTPITEFRFAGNFDIRQLNDAAGNEFTNLDEDDEIMDQMD